MTTPHASLTQDIHKTLGREAPGRRRWWLILAGLVVVAVASAAILLRAQQQGPEVQYETAPATRETLTVTVTATGALESLTQVNVGTEISGTVEQVLVDFNTSVTVGQLLASINTDKLRAQAAQARGALEAARAKRQQVEATLSETRTQLERLEQVRALSGGRVPSQQEFDTQVAMVRRADADLASAIAQVVQAEASVTAIEADLSKAQIRSPINGIVLDRQVDPGQTVAASLQTPTLFTLAEDLKRMKLIVDVDEADVGNVAVGQPATFRVDAYPDQLFESKVTEVRSTPKTSNGVVTYQTILAVDNSRLLLKPGMTATADITVVQIADALLVPSAALRFSLPAAEPADGFFGSLIPRPPQTPRRTEGDPQAPQRVWLLHEGRPTAVPVITGFSDGRVTEVKSGEVQPGSQVILDVVAAGD